GGVGGDLERDAGGGGAGERLGAVLGAGGGRLRHPHRVAGRVAPGGLAGRPALQRAAGAGGRRGGKAGGLLAAVPVRGGRLAAGPVRLVEWLIRDVRPRLALDDRPDPALRYAE